MVRGRARQVVLCAVRPVRSRGSRCRLLSRTEFDEWLASMVRQHGEFTVLVILTEIAERSVAPLCSTYLHVIGDEVDWDDITTMFAGSGQSWDGAAFFPTKAPNGGPVDNPTARAAPGRAGSQGHRGPHDPQRRPFLRHARPPHQDRADGRRMTSPVRILDTGLSAGALERRHDGGAGGAACGWRRARYRPLPPLSARACCWGAASELPQAVDAGLLPARTASRSRAASPAAAPST